MSKSRTHKQEVEATKTDAYQSGYTGINNMGFAEAWAIAAKLDPGLPKQPPQDISKEAQRAITGLMRRVVELETEWS